MRSSGFSSVGNFSCRFTHFPIIELGKHSVMRLSLGPFLALREVQLFALLCAIMAGTSSIHAATITVTNTADSGAGSLRDALAMASDGDTIQFDAALNGQSIMLTSAELAIDKHITIDGPGADQLAVTRSSGAFRIFHVLPDHIVTIEGLTISAGQGINGGGLLNDHATLTLNNCAVQNNSARFGGGVYNDASGSGATLNIFNTIVSGNLSSSTGNSAFGGGICNIDTGANLTITNSAVNGNVSNSADSIACSGFGGGIHNGAPPGALTQEGGTVTITNSVVSNNSAGQGSGPPSPCGYGGGISNYGPMSITNSTISGNTAGLHGGGISHFHGTLTINSSTINANSAIGINHGTPEGTGGGIESQNTMTITNSTISGNSANSSAGGIAHGIVTKIKNSTISGNAAPQGGGIASSAAEACSPCQLEIANTILQAGAEGTNIFMFNNTGTATSLGYNLSSDDGSGVLTATGDRINADPMLGPLQNNGGPTFTHDLLAGSPAVNGGDPNFTPPPLYDQRGSGYDRVVNGRIDIGSLEIQGALPTPTPTAKATATATATPTATATATATATVSPTPTPPAATPTPPPPAAQALQLSTRMLVQTGDNVAIGGFIITGSVPKQVMLRAVGPTLAQFGIPNPLADPVMELHGPPGFVTIFNDNCSDGFNIWVPSPFCSPTSLDAGIVATLAPGAYTAVVKGKSTASGVALVEVYDLTQGVDSKLANISTRAFVGTTDNIVIAGFILGGNSGPDRIIVRGVGPSLSALGVPNALANPTLEVRDENGVLLAANNDWQENPAQAAELTAAGLAPGNPLESGIAITLPPGPYTALLGGLNSGTGVGVVEVYDRGGPP